MPHKTDAVKLLDQLSIYYQLREYQVDENDLSAETVAAKVGLPPAQVFKTLVALKFIGHQILQLLRRPRPIFLQ